MLTEIYIFVMCIFYLPIKKVLFKKVNTEIYCECFLNYIINIINEYRIVYLLTYVF